jgi:hypothetical protein
VRGRTVCIPPPPPPPPSSSLSLYGTPCSLSPPHLAALMYRTGTCTPPPPLPPSISPSLIGGISPRAPLSLSLSLSLSCPAGSAGRRGTRATNRGACEMKRRSLFQARPAAPLESLSLSLSLSLARSRSRSLYLSAVTWETCSAAPPG